MASDWIDRHLSDRLIANEERDRANEKVEEARRGAYSFWQGFEHALLADIAKINQSEELRKIIGGAIELRSQGGGDYHIVKTVFPAIYMDARRNGLDIVIEKSTVTVDDPRRFGQRGGKTSTKKERETLRILFENERLFFKTPDEGVNSMDDLSEYLLRQFIVPHTVFKTSPWGGDFEEEFDANDDEYLDGGNC